MTEAIEHSIASRPAVSVVLCCRNESEHIRLVLRSILGQTGVAGGFEIIVADGCSDDGTREILAEIAADCPRVRIIDNPGRIAASGLNCAIRAAHGEIIVRVDAHTEYAPDYVARCIETLQATDATNVGGPARTRAITAVERAIAAAYHSPFAVGGARFHNVEYEGWVDTVTYGCWRKGAFARFGYFDEELVRNQDDEHNLRIVRGGGKIWQSPEIKSWYRPRSSLQALFRQYMQYGYWKVRVIQKHRIPASWRHLVPGAFLLGLLLLTVTTLVCLVVPEPWSLRLGHYTTAAFVSLSALYLLAVCAASCWTARQAGWDIWPLLPLVFPCYHFGYGYGFLRGLWDFSLGRRQVHREFMQLTRAVASRNNRRSPEVD